MKKQSVAQGTFILVIAGLITKILVYKSPKALIYFELLGILTNGGL